MFKEQKFIKRPKVSVLIFFGFLITSVLYNAQTAAAQQPGSLDPTFDGDGKVITNTSSSESASEIAVQADGRIVVAGTTLDASGNFQFAVLRYNPNGSLDTSFDGDGKATVQPGETESLANGMTLQPDGKILVAGQGNRTVDGNIRWDFALVRYNPDGSVDTGFGTNGKVITDFGGDQTEYAQAVAVQADGKIVVAGYRATIDSEYAIALARYNPDGSLDQSFGTGGKVLAQFGYLCAAFDVKVLGDGKIIVAGDSAPTFGSNLNAALARFNPDGTLDTTFDGDGRATFAFGTNSDYAFAMAVQPDGKIVTAGYSRVTQFNFDFAIARINTDGSLDPTFDGDGKVTTPIGTGRDAARAIILQPDGKIVAAGESENDTAKLDFSLVRYLPNGSIDTTFGSNGKVLTAFGTNTDDYSTALALQPDGKLIAAGSTSPSPIGNSDFALARYNNDISNNLRYTPFDFDGDSKTDIGIFRPNAGEWWLNRSSTGLTVAARFGASTDKPTPADFTGDGKTDIAFFRPSTGEWFILRSENGSFLSFPFGASNDVPVASDFDGDGKADPGVFRPSTGEWFISRSSGGTTILTFGASGDVPVTADYDGDGKADIAIFRPSDGSWWYLRSSDAGFRVYRFGVGTDKPVEGDYTGDGKADIAVFRPSTGEWFVQRSEDNSFFSFTFGTSGDVPAAGDYDADGKFDPGVFRPSTAEWFVLRSTAGILITTFGTTGDRPIPNSFVP